MNMKKYDNKIGGEWRGGEYRENINPSNTEDIIGLYARASTQDTRDAIDAARAAFPAWSSLVPYARGQILQEASLRLRSKQEELGRMLSREEGKTLAEGIAEVVRAAQIFDFFAAESTRITGDVLASVRLGVEVTTRRVPVGVVGIVSPWNFPIAIPAWKIAPALCYGNTVVFKPAELVPGSAWSLVEILHQAGLPDGVLNLVNGPGSVVGDEISRNPGVDAISFTGSEAVGQQIAAHGASRLCKVQLELGGKNPLVIADDADLNVAVDCAINGSFYSTGQRCTASSRLIATQGIHDRFVAALVERMNSLQVGDALDSSTDIGPVVDQGQLDTDLEYLDIGRSEGAELASGGYAVSETGKPGFYLAPALFTQATNDMRISREEIFGPIASVIRADDFEHALSLANDTDFGLAAGICTTSLKFASQFQQRAQAGMTMVNLPTAGVDFHVPFGGTKSSGYGPKEQGRSAIEFFTETKTNYVSA